MRWESFFKGMVLLENNIPEPRRGMNTEKNRRVSTLKCFATYRLTGQKKKSMNGWEGTISMKIVSDGKGTLC